MDRSQIDQAYARLQAARQQQAEPTKPEGQQYENVASTAKEIAPQALEGTALGRAENLKPAFDRAQQVQQPASKEQGGRVGGVDPQIARHAPPSRPKPPQQLAQGPDRQAYNADLAKSRQRAADLNKEIKARQPQRENEKIRDDRERD